MAMKITECINCELEIFSDKEDVMCNKCEENQVLRMKVDRYEKAIKLSLETLENNNLMNDEYKRIHAILDGNGNLDTPEFLKTDERKYFVVFEHADEIVVTVKDDVNRPNNPDCEAVLSEWLSENYGSDEYDYWEITNIEKISL